MLTKNFTPAIINLSSNQNPKLAMTDISGWSNNVFASQTYLTLGKMFTLTNQTYPALYSSSSTNDIGYCAFAIGSGETIDNNFVGQLIDYTNISLVSTSNIIDTTTAQKIFSQQYSYSGSASINITEIGLILKGNNFGNQARDMYMIAYQKLDNPVTVDSERNTFTVSMTIG